MQCALATSAALAIISHWVPTVRAAEEAVGGCKATLDQLRLRRADAFKAASMDQACFCHPYLLSNEIFNMGNCSEATDSPVPCIPHALFRVLSSSAGDTNSINWKAHSDSSTASTRRMYACSCER